MNKKELATLANKTFNKRFKVQETNMTHVHIMKTHRLGDDFDLAPTEQPFIKPNQEKIEQIKKTAKGQNFELYPDLTPNPPCLVLAILALSFGLELENLS